jgi:NADPH-dependent curcumin reductase CurA
LTKGLKGLTLNLKKTRRRVSMKGWISAKGKRGMYKEELKLRVPRQVRKLIEQRAREKGMIVSEYLRSLVYQDLEKRYGEQINQL